MRRVSIILAALFFSIAFVACGQKGALKLPPDAPVASAKGTPPGVDK